MEILGHRKFYQLKNDTTDYKNDRLIDIQRSAYVIGIEEWKMKTLVAWFRQENGAFSENTRNLTTKEDSLGLCQCSRWHRTNCAPADYQKQKNQCLEWFRGYTENSTPETLHSDLRRGHNGNAWWYEKEIKEKELLFIF